MLLTEIGRWQSVWDIFFGPARACIAGVETDTERKIQAAGNGSYENWR